MTDELPLPPKLAGRYRPIGRLGAGGMGCVYEVEHLHTGERVALKLLDASVASDPVAVERFRREARVFAAVKSEHIVRVIDADVATELGGAPFLVMELLRGDDLGRLIAREGPQAPPEVIDWLAQAASALDRAHALGIVHRDLKPSNLFVTREPGKRPALKVLDFGVAKLTSESEGPTRTGTTVGTPRYMAPEQASIGSGRIGPAADQWAVGLIAYALLAGRHYFDGRTPEELLAAILFAPLVAPSQRGCDFGAAFDDWFLRTCQRDPTRRFSSVGAQVDALAAALEGRTQALTLDRAGVDALSADGSAGTPATGSVEDATARTLATGTLVATGATLAATESEVSAPSRRERARWVAAAAIGAVLAVSAAVVLGRSTPTPEPPVLAIGASATPISATTASSAAAAQGASSTVTLPVVSAVPVSAQVDPSALPAASTTAAAAAPRRTPASARKRVPGKVKPDPYASQR